MKGFSIATVFTLLGIAVLVIGMVLPLWSKNGVTVTAWEGHYLGVGRWVLLVSGIGSLLPVFVKPLRRTWWQFGGALLNLFQACLILWKGYKLEAMGTGAVCLLLAGLLLLPAAFFHRRGG